MTIAAIAATTPDTGTMTVKKVDPGAGAGAGVAAGMVICAAPNNQVRVASRRHALTNVQWPRVY
jgi:hypothetical protein